MADIEYQIHEVFPDGQSYFLTATKDKFDAEVIARNYSDCTNALRNGWSRLEIYETVLDEMGD